MKVDADADALVARRFAFLAGVLGIQPHLRLGGPVDTEDAARNYPCNCGWSTDLAHRLARGNSVSH